MGEGVAAIVSAAARVEDAIVAGLPWFLCRADPVAAGLLQEGAQRRIGAGWTCERRSVLSLGRDVIARPVVLHRDVLPGRDLIRNKLA